MRIAQVIPGLNIGGTQKVVLTILSNPRLQNDYKVVVATASVRNKTLETDFAKVSQRLYLTDLSSSLPKFRPYRVFSTFNGIYRTLNSKFKIRRVLIKLRNIYRGLLS